MAATSTATADAAAEKPTRSKAAAERLAERPAPTNVIEAIARIMEELPGIGRDEQSSQGYAYRGIESITRHAQGLLGKYCVVFVPRVVGRTVKDFTSNNKPWTEDQLEVIYRVYGPGGPATDDFIEVGPLFGLGRDNSDKGANKAMTQAYKYALIQTFCIGDAKDDNDGKNVERDAGDGSWGGWPSRGAYEAARDAIVADIKAADSPAIAAACKEYTKVRGLAWPMEHAPFEEFAAFVRAAIAAGKAGQAIPSPALPETKAAVDPPDHTTSNPSEPRVMGKTWTQSVAIACRKLWPEADKDELDERRHALVRLATDGRSESSKDVRSGEEAGRVRGLIDTLEGGGSELVKIGEEWSIEVIAPESTEEEGPDPFDSSAGGSSSFDDEEPF